MTLYAIGYKSVPEEVLCNTLVWSLSYRHTRRTEEREEHK